MKPSRQYILRNHSKWGHPDWPRYTIVLNTPETDGSGSEFLINKIYKVDTGYVICDLNGKPVTTRTQFQQIKDYVKELNESI